MHTEFEISSESAIEVIRLIEEYLFQGGTGRNEEILLECLAALQEADRIVIKGNS